MPVPEHALAFKAERAVRVVVTKSSTENMWLEQAHEFDHLNRVWMQCLSALELLAGG